MKKVTFNQLMYGISIVLVLGIFYSVIDKFFLKDTNHGIALNETVRTQENDIVFGNSHAPQTVYLYFSYNCGYCKRFFREVFPKLKTNYIEKGKIELVVKLVEFGQDPDMMYALQMLIGLNKYGQFEKLHQLLLHDSKVVHAGDFKDLCDDIVSSNADIAEYILEDKASDYLKGNEQKYMDLNLTGTPSFIINQKLYKGYLDYSEFENILSN